MQNTLMLWPWTCSSYLIKFSVCWKDVEKHQFHSYLLKTSLTCWETGSWLCPAGTQLVINCRASSARIHRKRGRSVLQQMSLFLDAVSSQHVWRWGQLHILNRDRYRAKPDNVAVYHSPIIKQMGSLSVFFASVKKYLRITDDENRRDYH